MRPAFDIFTFMPVAVNVPCAQVSSAETVQSQLAATVLETVFVEPAGFILHVAFSVAVPLFAFVGAPVITPVFATSFTPEGSFVAP